MVSNLWPSPEGGAGAASKASLWREGSRYLSFWWRCGTSPPCAHERARRSGCECSQHWLSEESAWMLAAMGGDAKVLWRVVFSSLLDGWGLGRPEEPSTSMWGAVSSVVPLSVEGIWRDGTLWSLPPRHRHRCISLIPGRSHRRCACPFCPLPPCVTRWARCCALVGPLAASLTQPQLSPVLKRRP